MVMSFEVRLLDGEGGLLGGTLAELEAAPDASFWAVREVKVTIVRAGRPAAVSVVWPALRAERRFAVIVREPMGIGDRQTVLVPGPVFIVGAVATNLPEIPPPSPILKTPTRPAAPPKKPKKRAQRR